jgi:hypothetical protein
MSILALPVEERVCFGRGIPRAVNALLQQAAASTGDFAAAERALLAARALAPAQLEVLIALYKLYFYNGRIGQAEEVVIETLCRAAHKGGFDPDWRRLERTSADWRDASGPARVYLYSLKALAFIRIRCNDRHGADELLATLRRLDPHDRVGAVVIGDLAAALEEA